jgi:hypothetical protein
MVVYSMNVIRVRSTKIVEHIEPHLSFSDPRLKAPFLEELVQRMLNAPDSLLVLAAMEGETLKAFLIAQNAGPSVPYITVNQVWSDSDNSREWFEPFLAKLILWTAANDKDYIRGETPRSTRALLRRFGFEPYTEVVKFDLVKTRFHELLVKRPEEILQWATSLSQT